MSVMRMTRRECVHEWSQRGTLMLTQDTRRKYAQWSACCTACKQWTGWMMTREEAIRRAKIGMWCK